MNPSACNSGELYSCSMQAFSVLTSTCRLDSRFAGVIVVCLHAMICERHALINTAATPYLVENMRDFQSH